MISYSASLDSPPEEQGWILQENRFPFSNVYDPLHLWCHHWHASLADTLCKVSTLVSGSCAGQLPAPRLALSGLSNGLSYFVNEMFGATYFR